MLFRVPYTELYHELEKYGCTVPNCKSTIWSETKADTAIITRADQPDKAIIPGQFNGKNRVSVISYNFPSTIKVGFYSFGSIIPFPNNNKIFNQKKFQKS